MPSKHLILCRPLLLLPSIFPSIRVFSYVSALFIKWPKYWSFSFSISPSNEYSGLISFRIEWFYLLAVLWSLKSLCQHHFESINSSVPSLLYVPTLASIHDYWRNCTPVFLPGKSHGGFQRSLAGSQSIRYNLASIRHSKSAPLLNL